MARFSIYTAVSIAFCLGFGALGPIPQAAAASSSALHGSTAPVSLSDDAMSEVAPDSYQPAPERPNKLPAADVARPPGGASDGQGSGSNTSNGSVMCRPSSPVALLTTRGLSWTATPDDPFVRSGEPTEVYEPPRPGR